MLDPPRSRWSALIAMPVSRATPVLPPNHSMGLPTRITRLTMVSVSCVRADARVLWLMCSRGCTGDCSWQRHVEGRVLGDAVAPDLEVQVRPRRVAAAAGEPDDVTGADRVAVADRDRAEVRVQR